MDTGYGFNIEAIEKKWGKMLDGLDGRVKRSTAIMLENQYKDLVGNGMLSENNTGGGDTMGVFQRSGGYATSGDFHKIAIPMVRRTFPELVAHDLVGVQPLTGPVGIAFALRFRAGNSTNSYSGATSGTELGYNTIDSAFSGSMATSAGEMLGSYASGTAIPSAGGNLPLSSYGLGLGAGNAIKEVSFDITKSQVEAQTRKLRSRWSLEVAQDLRAMHGLNIEDEMMDILAYEITAEIDREVMTNIRTAATNNSLSYCSSAGTSGSIAGSGGAAISWSASANFDGRWEAEKYRNLFNRAVRQANKIAISTRRGAGNFIVANPTLSAAFEMTSSFTIAPVQNNIDTAKTGVAFLGTMDGRMKLYRDTFCTQDEYVVGYKGSSAYDAGVIFLPYVQLQISKAIMEDSFSPAVGLMSRYAILGNMFGSQNYYIRTEITGMP